MLIGLYMPSEFNSVAPATQPGSAYVHPASNLDFMMPLEALDLDRVYAETSFRYGNAQTPSSLQTTAA